MTTFFSVDVETSSTSIHHPHGLLLSLGCEVVAPGRPLLDGALYEVVVHHPTLTFDRSTYKWWSDQDPARLGEAIQNGRPAGEVARSFAEWAEIIEPEFNDRVFVANPATFDRAWIDKLFHDANVKNPFGYRSLCLRSMHFGLRDVEWGASRSEWEEFHVAPDRPHNALSDASAQAEELRRMLEARGR